MRKLYVTPAMEIDLFEDRKNFILTGSTLSNGSNVEITTTDLMMDDAPFIIDADVFATPEASIDSEATMAPEATFAPEVTFAPEITAAPEATAIPEITAEPVVPALDPVVQVEEVFTMDLFE